MDDVDAASLSSDRLSSPSNPLSDSQATSSSSSSSSAQFQRVTAAEVVAKIDGLLRPILDALFANQPTIAIPMRSQPSRTRRFGAERLIKWPSENLAEAKKFSRSDSPTQQQPAWSSLIIIRWRFPSMYTFHTKQSPRRSQDRYENCQKVCTILSWIHHFG